MEWNELRNFVINIPRTVQNDFDGINYLTSLFDTTKHLFYTNIELNFIQTRWFEANLASILGAWVETKLGHGCRIILNHLNASIENVFLKNGFYEKYNLGNLRDTYDSTIKFKVFLVEEDDEFTNYVTESVIPKIRLNLSNPVMRGFKLSLNEIFINVQLHAKSDKVYTCGQYYHTHQKVAFTITDLGQTIGYNVRQKFDLETLLDHDAIEWATRYGHTTKTHSDSYTEAGGIGLHIIEEFLIQNNGIFQIISGNGYWENNEGFITKKTLNSHFPGTIVNIISKLENTFVYKEDILF